MFKKDIKKTVAMKEARSKNSLIEAVAMKETRSKNSLIALPEEQSKFQIIEGIQISENILTAISDDGPALVIQWNFEAFNNVNNSRDGDPTHTIADLVEFIKSAGGEDLFDKNMIFMFQTERDFFECFHNLPDWSRRTPGMPDIARSLKINCNAGEYDIARFDMFNWP